MRLSETEMRRLLPSVIRDDPYHVELSKVVDGVARDVWERSRLLTIWDRLDELPEDYLDRLAGALHVEWYETGAPIETKRQLIRTSDLVHMKKGTAEAVETVVRAYFGDGYIEEWDQYGGDPFHFKVFTTNPSAVYRNQARFEDLLRKVKRHSAKLDSITIGLTGRQRVYVGSALRDYAHETHAFGRDRIEAYAHVGSHVLEEVVVRMGDVGDVTPEGAYEAIKAKQRKTA